MEEEADVVAEGSTTMEAEKARWVEFHEQLYSDLLEATEDDERWRSAMATVFSCNRSIITNVIIKI